MTPRPLERQLVDAAAVLGTSVTLLFSMIGNASLFGVDIGLSFVLPVCLFFVLLVQPGIRMSDILFISVGGLATFLLTLQAFNIEELHGYELWPIKATMTAFLVTKFNKGVDNQQFFAIFVFAILLMLSTEDVDGRSYGLFGPNMLYRFYCLLFFVAFYLLWSGQRHPMSYWGAIALSVFGVVLTGSVGGLLVLSVGLLLFFRSSLRFFAVIGIGSGLLFLIGPYIENLTIVQRLISKTDINSVLQSTRVTGMLLILDYPFSLTGRSYVEYSGVWKDLYLYPHNIFVELYAFFGLSGITLSIVLVAMFFSLHSAVRSGNCTIFHLAFVCVFLGSNLSGDLSDNYGAVGLAIGLFMLGLERKKSVKLR